MDAICFVLFGKPFRQSNKGSLVNNINQKDCFVSISFTKNGNSYIIERGIKPNIFKIYKNGELIPEDSKLKDYQKYLEENILGFTFISFCQVVLVGSVNFKPFMQLSTSERRNFVEEIVGIDLFSLIQDLSKKELTEKNADITNLNYKKIECETKLDTYDKLLENIGENKKKKLTDLESKLDAETSVYNDLDLEKNTLQQKGTDIKNVIDGFDKVKIKKDFSRFLSNKYIRREKYEQKKHQKNNHHVTGWMHVHRKCTSHSRSSRKNHHSDCSIQEKSKKGETGNPETYKIQIL